jgi:hypothetical protein
LALFTLLEARTFFVQPLFELVLARQLELVTTTDATARLTTAMTSPSRFFTAPPASRR